MHALALHINMAIIAGCSQNLILRILTFCRLGSRSTDQVAISR